MFAFVNHGSIIVVVPEDKETTQIEYSFNFGKEWTKLQIFAEKTKVDRIEVETSGKALVAMVVAESGAVSQIDFADSGVAFCDKEKDFETFVPSDHKGKKCLSGMTVDYIRKKPENTCLLSVSWVRAIYETTCNCTIEDFECDLGFERKDAVCVKSDDYVEPDYSRYCHKYYYITRGYRRIPGNACIDNKQFDPIKVSCRVDYDYGLLIGAIVILSIALIAAISYLVSRGSFSFTFSEMNAIFEDESVGLKRY